MAEALLRAGPGVCVVATSREPLRAAGEYVYRVPSLDVPDEETVNVEDVLLYGAVKLFVARAQAAEPRFVLDRRVAPAAAAICRHLDGLPLAIELAAARIAAFGVEDTDYQLRALWGLWCSHLYNGHPREGVQLAEKFRAVRRRRAIPPTRSSAIG